MINDEETLLKQKHVDYIYCYPLYNYDLLSNLTAGHSTQEV
jgi:hypothetical protein